MRLTVMLSIDALGQHTYNKYKALMPNLARLEAEGFGVDEMLGTFPTATWSLHTSIVTGCYPAKHGIVSNRFFERETGQLKTVVGDADITATDVTAPTIYDVAAGQDMTVAAVSFPLTRSSRSITYNIPKFYDQTLYDSDCADSPIWQELSQSLDLDHYGEWTTDFSQGDKADRLTNDIARYLISNKRPDLVLMHYLWVDSIMHLNGVDAEATITALKHSDQLLGELLGEIDKCGRDANVFVFSDHGQIDFDPNLFQVVPFLYQQGLYGENQHHITQGGCYFLYEDDPGRVAEIARSVSEVETVAAVYTDAEFHGIGLPTTAENRYMADLVIDMEPGHVVNAGLPDDQPFATVPVVNRRYKAMHGYAPDHQTMRPILVGRGPGLRSGVRLERARIIDIAPTIARAMGLQMPDIDGEVLDACLAT